MSEDTTTETPVTEETPAVQPEYTETQVQLLQALNAIAQGVQSGDITAFAIVTFDSNQNCRRHALGPVPVLSAIAMMQIFSQALVGNVLAQENMAIQQQLQQQANAAAENLAAAAEGSPTIN